MFFKEETFPLTREGWERAKQSTVTNKIKKSLEKKVISGMQMDTVLTSLLGLSMFYHSSVTSNEIIRIDTGMYRILGGVQFLGFGLCMSECLFWALDCTFQNDPKLWIKYYLTTFQKGGPPSSSGGSRYSDKK
jgi:hypothetical protein